MNYSISVTFSIDYSDPECFSSSDLLTEVVTDISKVFGTPHSEVDKKEDPVIQYEYHWSNL
jgi:hypothetical protein